MTSTRLLLTAGVLSIFSQIAFCQDTYPAPAPLGDSENVPVIPVNPQTNPKRLFGILPNYKAINANQPFVPITAKQKLSIAGKDAFDYPVFATTAVYSGLYQLQNTNPTYGQGMAGYSKRYAAALVDQSVGNVLQEGIYPALFHSDPRYFRLGSSGGSTGHRLRYALSRVVVTRTDRGTSQFNFAEWAGAATSVAGSNLYYDASSRTVVGNVQRLSMQVAGDALSNVLREFIPDWTSKRAKQNHK